MRIQGHALTMDFHDGEKSLSIFNNLNFEIQSGETVSIVGESGVGKTTLLYIMGGLEYPSSGELIVGERSLMQLSKRRDELSDFRGKNVGFIFQFHNLLREFTALENVIMPLLIAGADRDTAIQRAREMLGLVGLEERENHKPGTLSGGEQQRVAIARALIRGPKVLLADEPTGNLDHRTGGQVSDLLLEIQRQVRFTLVVVTHSRELASRMSRKFELTQDGLSEVE